VSIDLKKCCGTHSKEKEDNGECCQIENEKEILSFLVKEFNKSRYNKEPNE